MITNLPVLGTIYSQNKTFVVMGVKIKATGNLELSGTLIVVSHFLETASGFGRIKET